MFVCASCRRRLFQSSNFCKRALGKHRRSYTELGDGAFLLRSQPVERQRQPQTQKPQSQSIEEDFLQRLFKSRDRNKLSGPYSSQQTSVAPRPIQFAGDKSVIDTENKDNVEKLVSSLSENAGSPVGERGDLDRIVADGRDVAGQSLDAISRSRNSVNIHRHRDGAAKTFEIRAGESTASQTFEDPDELSIVEENAQFEELRAAISSADLPTHELCALFVATCRSKMPLELRKDFLAKVVKEWCNNISSSSAVRPSGVFSSMSRKIHLIRTSWITSIWTILNSRINTDRFNNPEANDHLPEAYLEELVDMWLVFLSCTAYPLRGQFGNNNKFLRRANPDWKRQMRTGEFLNQMRNMPQKSVNERLRSPLVVTSLAQHLLGHDIDTALLTTYVVLSSQSWTNMSADKQTDILNLQHFVSCLLIESNENKILKRHRRNLAAQGFPSVVIESIISNIDHAAVNAVSDCSNYRNQLWPSNDMSMSSADHDSMEKLFVKRISRAVDNGRRTSVDNLWEEAKRYYSNRPLQGEKACIPTNVYTRFLSGYMALRAPNLALRVWNHAMEDKITPTVSMWNTMIKGFATTKDPKSLEITWSKMLSSGIKPDVQIWSTRIHGLATTGNWQKAIVAFEEMISIWVAALEQVHGKIKKTDYPNYGDVQDVPKPNIETVNGLINRLDRGRHHREVAFVLSRADELGIRPDVITYNTLIRSALEQKDYALAAKLVGRIQDAGLTPDGATFTLVLGSQFGKASSTASDASRTAILQQLLKEMQLVGVKPSTHTYSALISGILKDESARSEALAAVNTMLTEMDETGVPRSSQIYTSLIMFYFSQDSPDLHAVEIAWKLARKDTSFSYLDLVFYDRLIEGFARNGDVARMKAALNEALKIGRHPGWPAMAEVVTALVTAGDWQGAQSHVDKVLREEERAKDSPRQSTGKRYFWDTVAQFGLNLGSR